MYVVPFDSECEACGYNLRGLPRSEVVCPECGHAADFAHLLDRHLRRLEAEEADRPERQRRFVDSLELGARISAWGLSLLILTGVMAVADSWSRTHLATPLLASALITCLLGASIFFARTQGRPRRWYTFARYQVNAVPFLSITLGTLLTGTGVLAVAAKWATLPFLIGAAYLVTHWNPLQFLAVAARGRIEALAGVGEVPPSPDQPAGSLDATRRSGS
ncbi:MAG: hypothetical protein AMXMBFR47_12120 [Planctomycetota bacterium]